MPTDVAFWLTDSIYDMKPDWKPEDEHKSRANAVLAMVTARQAMNEARQEKRYGNPS